MPDFVWNIETSQAYNYARSILFPHILPLNILHKIDDDSKPLYQNKKPLYQTSPISKRLLLLKPPYQTSLTS
jgi:hypothetical protein